MRRRWFGLVAAILLLATFAPQTGALARSSEKPDREVDVEVRHLPADFKQPKLSLQQARRMVERSPELAAAAQQLSVVGDEKVWLAADFVDGSFYLKEYTLRAIGDHIEVFENGRPVPQPNGGRHDLGVVPAVHLQAIPWDQPEHGLSAPFGIERGVMRLDSLLTQAGAGANRFGMTPPPGTLGKTYQRRTTLLPDE